MIPIMKARRSDGDPRLKVRTIEYLNDRIVRPVLDRILKWDCPVSVALLPDHPTPCSIRTHTADPVPFTIFRTSGCGADGVREFDEFSAAKGCYGTLPASRFMDLFIEQQL